MSVPDAAKIVSKPDRSDIPHNPRNSARMRASSRAYVVDRISVRAARNKRRRSRSAASKLCGVIVEAVDEPKARTSGSGFGGQPYLFCPSSGSHTIRASPPLVSNWSVKDKLKTSEQYASAIESIARSDRLIDAAMLLPSALLDSRGDQLDWLAQQCENAPEHHRGLAATPAARERAQRSQGHHRASGGLDRGRCANPTDRDRLRH